MWGTSYTCCYSWRLTSWPGYQINHSLLLTTILQAGLAQTELPKKAELNISACAAAKPMFFHQLEITETIHPPLNTLFFISDNNAVLGPAVGHSLLCVNPLHQPLPGQGCATGRLWWRRKSPTERWGTYVSVQKCPVPVMGLSAHVSGDTEYGCEVSIDHIKENVECWMGHL